MTIIEYIQQYVNPRVNPSAPLPFATQERTFGKNEVLTAFGQIEDKAYYLTQGIVEISLLENGQEKILDFFFPGSFVAAYTSFLTQLPSDAQLVALTECQAQMITRQDLQDAYRTSLLANQLGRYVTERLYITRTRREKEFLTMSAEQRYRALINQRPDLVAQVPVHKVAKYLGIHPESLSRIRKQVIF